MSEFATSVPIAHGLWVAPKDVGLDISWKANKGSYLQELMIMLKKPSLALAETMDRRVLRSVADNKASTANDFLKKEGFSIQLTDMGSLNMLYVAAVMKLMGEFFVSGVTGYWLETIEKKGFRLSPRAGVAHYVYAPGDLHVVEIPTTGDFSLMVARPSGVSGWKMLADWARIFLEMKQIDGRGVVLPQAKIDEASVNVKQLIGMSGEGWVIQEALMAAKFGLSNTMVKFEAAFAMSAKRGAKPVQIPEEGDYIADHDLYFALRRTGHLLPIAAGIVPAAELSDETELM